MTSILVTGAPGFIGRHLVPLLRGEGADVIPADSSSGDIADAATWARFPRADVVIHLAGRSYVPDSWSEPAAYLRVNLLGTIAALDYCRAHGARMVFVSSYLYGGSARLPISEAAPLTATNPYALSKKLAEDACRFFAGAYGLDVTVLRPFNVYGPGQEEPFLIPFILRQLEGGVEIRVKDLEPRRDYVYVRDVAEAIARAAAGPGGFRVFNVGSGTSHSVEQLIRTVQEVWSTSLPVVADGERRRDEIMDTVADVTEAERQLGWRPRFTLRSGLEEMHRASAVIR